MPRSMLRDPEAERAKILFGSGATAANMAAVSRVTKIPTSTVSRYRKAPSNMPVSAFSKIAKARGVTDEEIIRFIRGKL